MAILYLEHVDSYYRKDGKPTSEADSIRIALRPLIKLYGSMRAREFSPLKLKAVREAMIEVGWVRTSINRHVQRITACWKWAAENELVPVAVWTGLRSIAGLRRGRSKAKESVPVKPVPEAFVDAVHPFVTTPVWGAIQVQQFSGMRPGETLAMRGCDLNMSGKIWEYEPESHKTEHHGKRRLIFLGPKAQAVLQEFLKTDLEVYLFSPRDGRADFVARSYRRGAALKEVGDRYTIYSYRRAIATACIRAGVPHWHPTQLRPNAVTHLRREFGIEAARIILGHSTAFTTEIYAEVDHAKAREIVARIG